MRFTNKIKLKKTEKKVGMLSIILAVIVAVDHALSQTEQVKSNSTGQLIVGVIGSVASSVLGSISKKR